MVISPTVKPRIVIYGVGQFGQYIARFATQKGWPIMAAFNRAGPKIGQDLGRIAGLDRDISVVVQDCETARYDTLDAEIGVVTMTDRLAENFPAYQRLMGAGLNVICHGAEAYYPVGSNPEMAAKIDALAKTNRVTFSGGGIWDMSRIWAGILVAGPCTEMTTLHHKSVTDVQRSGKHLMLVTGVGMTAEEYIERNAKADGKVGGMYKTIPMQVLAALGYTVTRASERREPVIFDAPFYCRLLERELPAGVCVGTRIIAEVETLEGVTASAHIELRLLDDGEIEHMMWSVDGKPASRIRVERDDSAHATASSLFNRIPDVIAAPPGIVAVSQMGPMRHTALA